MASSPRSLVPARPAAACAIDGLGWPARLAVAGRGQRAQRVRAHDLAGRSRRRASRSRSTGSSAAPVSPGRARRSASSSRRNPSCWPRVATPRSKASVPMATRQPSPASPTTRSAGGAGAVEEDLVELGRAGELAIGRISIAGLAHRHEQVGQARAAPRPRLGAGEHEAPVGHVRQRRPHLLPGDHPLVAVAGRPWSARRRGRSRRPARSSPGTTARRRRDRRQEPALLLRRAERDQRRAEQLLADVADPGRARRAGVLLVEDHLLRERGAAAAVLGRPAQAGPAGRGQVPVPGQPLVDAPRARGRGRPAPRSPANRPVSSSSSQARTRLRNASSVLGLRPRSSRASLHGPPARGLPAPWTRDARPA